MHKYLKGLVAAGVFLFGIGICMLLLHINGSMTVVIMGVFFVGVPTVVNRILEEPD